MFAFSNSSRHAVVVVVGKIYALKLLKVDEPEALQLVRGEVNTMRKFRENPHVIQIYEYEEDTDNGIVKMVCLPPFLFAPY